jgi:hypothetical protein
MIFGLLTFNLLRPAKAEKGEREFLYRSSTRLDSCRGEQGSYKILNKNTKEQGIWAIYPKDWK